MKCFFLLIDRGCMNSCLSMSSLVSFHNKKMEKENGFNWEIVEAKKRSPLTLSIYPSLQKVNFCLIHSGHILQWSRPRGSRWTIFRTCFLKADYFFNEYLSCFSCAGVQLASAAQIVQHHVRRAHMALVVRTHARVKMEQLVRRQAAAAIARQAGREQFAMKVSAVRLGRRQALKH